MADLSGFNIKAPDWRESIRVNQKKTRFVIFTFVVVYLGLGLLVDLYMNMTYYNAPPSLVFKALISLQLIPYGTLIMAAVAAISLLITYSAYDRIMLLGTSYRRITPQTAKTLQEKQLYNVVDEMKIAAGVHYMPRVYIIEADYMNAFASGYSEKSAMVAITRGLLEKLDRAELTAVMAHELSHIRHQDIKLTLTVGVLSNIILIVIDILFYFVIYGRRSRDKESNQLATIIIILRFILPIVTVLLTLFLSRTREYMADAGCVELMRDNEPLARALMKIHEDHQVNRDEYAYQYGKTAHEDVRRASYLYDPVKAGIEPVRDISSAFSTHPKLDDRLKAIGFSKKN